MAMTFAPAGATTSPVRRFRRGRPAPADVDG